MWLEDHNRDRDRHHRQPWCEALSAWRLCLYMLNERGVKWSAHGLGHMLNPTDPDGEDRAWMRQVWVGTVQEALGRSFAWPGWLDCPAAVVGRNRMRAHRLRSDTTISRDHARLRPPIMPNHALSWFVSRCQGVHCAKAEVITASPGRSRFRVTHFVISAAEAGPQSFP